VSSYLNRNESFKNKKNQVNSAYIIIQISAPPPAMILANTTDKFLIDEVFKLCGFIVISKCFEIYSAIANNFGKFPHLLISRILSDVGQDVANVHY